MKSSHFRKALRLGGLLAVTLAVGCAGGPGWSYSRYGSSSGGYRNAYPNLDGSAGSYPYNSIYASAGPYNDGYGSYYPYDNGGYNRAYAYPVNHKYPSRDDENLATRKDNSIHHEKPNGETTSRPGHDRSGKSEVGSAPVYR